MEQNDRVNLIANLRQLIATERIETWFDLGLLLDRIKDRPVQFLSYPDKASFSHALLGKMGVVCREFCLSGAILQGAKIVSALNQLPVESEDKSSRCYLIGGSFSKEVDSLFSADNLHLHLASLNQESQWKDEALLFDTKLTRGSEEYNLLAKNIWDQACQIALELLTHVESHQLQSFFFIDTHGTPDYLPFSLASVLVAEYLHLPAFCYHHEYFQIEGANPTLKKAGEESRYEDRYFCNAHLGEVQSLIDDLHPWQSRLWHHFVSSNKIQDHFILELGINPLSLSSLPLTVDHSRFVRQHPDSLNQLLAALNRLFIDGQARHSYNSIYDLPENFSFHVDQTPLLLGNKMQVSEQFFNHCLLFLQPSSISRDHEIERNFSMIKQFLDNRIFAEFLRTHVHINICLLISGRLPPGQLDYFDELVSLLKSFLEDVGEEWKDRIYYAFLFGAEGRSSCPLTIESIYSLSDFVVCHSRYRFHGSTILESASVGTPILVFQSSHDDQLAQVIGSHLDETLRLDVFCYDDDFIDNKTLLHLIELVVDPEQTKLFSQNNRDRVLKRFENPCYEKFVKMAFSMLWHSCQSDTFPSPVLLDAFAQHHEVTQYDALFDQLVVSSNRKYIPGLTYLEFMIYLKSLIDPSYFRVEEMNLRGRIYDFVLRLESIYLQEREGDNASEARFKFYRSLYDLFDYYDGEDTLAIDHSISYRHRHRRHYPYRKLTEQELYGVVGVLFRHYLREWPRIQIGHLPLGHFSDLRSSILLLAKRKGAPLRMDDSDRLISELLSHKPFAVFPGHYFEHEFQVFGVNVFKERLGIPLLEPFSEEDLLPEKINKIGHVSFFARKLPLNDISYDLLIEWMESSASHDIKMLWKAGLIRLVQDDNLARGIHLGQIGRGGIEELLAIKDAKGFVVASSNSSFMLDMIDLPCFHIGQVKTALLASFMNLRLDDCYILWVPAGLKTSLAYPTPIQTPLDFYHAFHSELYDDCIRSFGEDKVLSLLRDDADRFGNPVIKVLEKMLTSGEDEKNFLATTITGIFSDGLPWSGALFKISLSDFDIDFSLKLCKEKAQPVVDLIKQFEADNLCHVSFGWNGGYILNNELVGKLGLAEQYIGTPLGLLIEKGKIFALPLYNKAALLIYHDGKMQMRRVSLMNGFELSFFSGALFQFSSKQRNISPENASPENAIFYDLLYPENLKFARERRILYRFAGNKIIDRAAEGDDFSLAPVGLVISIPEQLDPKATIGEEVSFDIPELRGVAEAVEAGPTLVENSKLAVDMEVEGWKTKNSIATQAARLDFTDMRGPKMVAGITSANELVLVAINGRIRESVGATHLDGAQILIDQGCVCGMGFDPGGSVTLVVDGVQQNISPYNKDYESNIYSLPPQARFVGNAILAVIRGKKSA